MAERSQSVESTKRDDELRELGDALSRLARHQLAKLCVEEIKREQKRKPTGAKRSGRPKSPEALLAAKLGVTQKSVHRWLDPEAVQAGDVNAGALCELAYEYDPVRTRDILLDGVNEEAMKVSWWLAERTYNMAVHSNKLYEFSDALEWITMMLRSDESYKRTGGVYLFTVYPEE